MRTMPYVVGRDRTTLVDADGTRARPAREPSPAGRRARRQAFYAGLVKPRELAHDSHVYRAYLRAAERLAARGAAHPPRRPRLRAEARLPAVPPAAQPSAPTTSMPTRADAAAGTPRNGPASTSCPIDDGHVQFPDVRIEYEHPDGRRDVEDVEVVTPHYRGAHGRREGARRASPATAPAVAG